LISAVLVPPPAGDMTGHYIKFTTGSSEERPCVGVATLVQMDNGICRELRLAVGAVSPHPIRVIAAEQLARDRILTYSLIDTIAAEATHAIDPVDDLRGPAEYKRHLVGVLVRRSIASIATGKVGPDS
jgi:carbon-monoxide dehydrogenase medium subunit